MFIIGGVYLKYFNTNDKIVEEISLIETNKLDRLKELEKKILDLELKNNKLNSKLSESKENLKINVLDNNKNEGLDIKKKEMGIIKIENENLLNETKKKKVTNKEEIQNLVKDVEYISIDQKGNKFYLIANSAKSNVNDSNILDLINVRGEITSDTRSTIYIVSDFAEYNSTNLNSKFYKNVIINYEDKEITCLNFDINMETNKAIAYNNVLVTDPKSTMKAGIIEFDLKTKNININPESLVNKIEVVTN